jgi:PKD repeat protein
MTPMTMKPAFRALCIGASLLIGTLAQAQPYDIYVMGYVNGCQAGSSVHISSLPGTVPAIDQDVPLNGCSLALILEMDTTTGGFAFSYNCLGSTMVDSVYYEVGQFPDSTSVTFSFNCGGTVDCLGQAGGPNLPGTSCLTFFGQPGTWSPDCLCIANPDSSDCQAMFTVEQASGGGVLIPWTVNTVNLSVGTGNLSYLWNLPDGSTSTAAEPSYTFNAPGWYSFCLTVSSDSGCTSTWCDSVVVDNFGYVDSSSVWYDCLGVAYGTALPGTACTDFLGNAGIWNSNCFCETDTTTCEAGFWAIQAYDSTGNGVEPIPNLVWVWNLSSGGNGTYSFVWDFGDGSSSTEAYPTHEYDGPGPWLLCLTMTSGNCTDTYCDSLSMDENGILEGMILDGGHPVAHDGNRSGGFTLNVISQIPGAIAELPAVAQLNLWPNPATDALNLSWVAAHSGHGTVQLLDLSGRTVQTTALRTLAGSNHLSLATDRLEPGLYLVQLELGGMRISQRFTKVQ